MAHDLTVEQLEACLPRKLRNNATQQLVDKVNNMVKDPLVREAYRDNLLSYTKVMEDGRFQIGHYIDAVRYITYKLMGHTNHSAYVKTFPDRFQNFVNNGTTSKDIASYITSYNKNKLVNLVREQTLIPTHVLNADYYQQAINKQAQMMMDSNVSPAVQQKAADSLLTHLKPPEASIVELDISLKSDNVIDDLRKTTQKLVEVQKNALRSGAMNAKDVAENPIKVIEGEVIDD